MADSNPLFKKLKEAQLQALNLTARNRLLHTPRTSSRSSRLEIVDELSNEIFRLLVQENKGMAFLPAEDPPEQADEDQPQMLPQPEDEAEENGSLAARHVDTRLQTDLNPVNLQRKLLNLSREARTNSEEKGSSNLFLALGFLRWFEDKNSEIERQSPLLLIPVNLERKSAGSRFQLRYTGGEITSNLTLQEKMKSDFGLQLPDIPDLADDVRIDDYLASVSASISDQQNWEVLKNDMVLWFFDWSKWPLYDDLGKIADEVINDPASQPLLQSLLVDGFQNDPPIADVETNLDAILNPLDCIHVVDADSSQTIAIEEVKQGRNLVLQGPPGTGKSQTIVNMIATAVKAGKSVLFVAEKMAALEVVKRRLDDIDLGDICLELHSNKANKRTVVGNLSKTLELAAPKVNQDEIHKQAKELQTYRDKLNRHAEILHTQLEPSGFTPFQVIGALVRLADPEAESPKLGLNAPLEWSSSGFHERQRLLGDLVAHMNEIGPPGEHPWRGVQLKTVLPVDMARFAAIIPEILGNLAQTLVGIEELAGIVRYEAVVTIGDLLQLMKIGKHILKSPPMDRSSMGDPVWQKRREDIDGLVEMGKSLAECREALKGSVADVAWTTDVNEARINIAAHGRSLFRFLYGSYRKAQATLRGILTVRPPKSVDKRLQLLDQLIRGQKCLNKIEHDDSLRDLGTRAFGEKWRGPDSDWDELEQIALWEDACRREQLPEDILRAMESVDDKKALKTLLKKISETLRPFINGLREIFKQLEFDLQAAFGKTSVGEIPIQDAKQRLEVWQTNTESITQWIGYSIRLKNLRPKGMGQLARLLDSRRVNPSEAPDLFEEDFYTTLIRNAFKGHPELSEFQGVSHEQTLARFKQLDKERLLVARKEVALAHYQGIPRYGVETGEVGVIRREAKKKSRHLPIRRLLREAGSAAQAIKPLFMMSPISVATYLERGHLNFDLLIFDEASQVRPEDALGAMSRAKQIVVVGDEKQLPPTSFFEQYLEVNEDKESAGFQVSDLQSILGLCSAQNMGPLIDGRTPMLQWHYRSRHSSLITVSNHEFYDNRLFIVPNPVGSGTDLGLRFHHIDGGYFDRGKSGTNHAEAVAIADAVMEHAEKHPDKTLGVGAFSVRQRDAILDQVELRRRERVELENFFSTSKIEPFFVKNLENIQGDERDVVFISVGYGKNSEGRMFMNFGPLNNEGGERRLNVLITRAKERCEVFSSITADDIDLSRTQARGVIVLKTFLSYAETGNLDIAMPTGRDFDSEFERQVAKELTASGCRVEPQVGVAGFFIDLAIVDPDRPGRFLLGIECDGATYHSTRSARERDRQRQAVLEDRGWIIHRIWSTDWFLRPEDELRKVMAAIEEARVIWGGRGRSATGNKPQQEPGGETRIERLEVEDSAGSGGNPIPTVPYEEADFYHSDLTPSLHAASMETVAEIVIQVVKIEGPVHRNVILRRISRLCELPRRGKRFDSSVSAGLNRAEQKGAINKSGDFFQSAGQRDLPIRNRSSVQCDQVKKPTHLPPAEIQLATLKIVEVSIGISRDDLSTPVARLFGFTSTTRQLKEVIQKEIEPLLRAGTLEERDGKLYLPQEGPGGSPPNRPPPSQPPPRPRQPSPPPKSKQHRETTPSSKAPLTIRVRTSSRRIEDQNIPTFTIEIKGQKPGPIYGSAAVDLFFHLFDTEVDEDGFEPPVLSSLDEFREENGPGFQIRINEKEMSGSDYFPDWELVNEVPLFCLGYPKKGHRKLKLRLQAFLADQTAEQTMFENGYLVRGGDTLHGEAKTTFTHEVTEIGWLDRYQVKKENLLKVRASMVELALHVAAADGSLDKSEAKVIKEWAKYVISLEPGDEEETTKRKLNSAIERSHAKALRGETSLVSICKELGELAFEEQKYEAIKLCLDVVSADGEANDAELKTLQQIVELMEVDPQEYRKLRDRHLVRTELDVGGTSGEDKKALLGIKDTDSKEEIRRKLTDANRQWNSRVTNPDPEIRKRSAEMLRLIAELRKELLG